MVLRDATGLVVDSLNYGLLVDPWAGEGYQATSGPTESGCRVVAPGLSSGFGPAASPVSASDTSAGRFPDGADTDSNCHDFVTEPATALSAAAASGAANIKVASVAGFEAGQALRIDTGASLETAVIATVGTPGATTMTDAASAGATVIKAANVSGFTIGQSITIGNGADQEAAVIAATTRRGAGTITVSVPLAHDHTAGTQVAGTGITLTTALTREHAADAQVAGSSSTPGAPNKSSKKQN
jgi:hypothetical protein